MDIEDLNGAWNSLMGRATKMRIAREIDKASYNRIWREHSRWRKWRHQSGPLDDMFATATTARQVKRYRAALEFAKKKGVHPRSVLEMTAIEQASRASDQLSAIILISVGFGVATLLATVVASTRGTGDRYG